MQAWRSGEIDDNPENALSCNRGARPPGSSRAAEPLRLSEDQRASRRLLSRSSLPCCWRRRRRRRCQRGWSSSIHHSDRTVRPCGRPIPVNFLLGRVDVLADPRRRFQDVRVRELPNRAVTTLAEGQSPLLSRSSAPPPRQRACVRDQSYEDGSRPRACHAPIAARTRSASSGARSRQGGTPCSRRRRRLCRCAVACKRRSRDTRPVAGLHRLRLLGGGVVKVRLDRRWRGAQTLGDLLRSTIPSASR